MPIYLSPKLLRGKALRPYCEDNCEVKFVNNANNMSPMPLILNDFLSIQIVNNNRLGAICVTTGVQVCVPCVAVISTVLPSMCDTTISRYLSKVKRFGKFALYLWLVPTL